MTFGAEVRVAPPAAAVKSMPVIERSAANEGMAVVAAEKIAESVVMLLVGAVLPIQLDPVAKSVPALFHVMAVANAEGLSREIATNKAALASRRRLELGGVWFELVIGKRGVSGGGGGKGREFSP